MKKKLIMLPALILLPLILLALILPTFAISSERYYAIVDGMFLSGSYHYQLGSAYGYDLDEHAVSGKPFIYYSDYYLDPTTAGGTFYFAGFYPSQYEYQYSFMMPKLYVSFIPASGEDCTVTVNWIDPSYNTLQTTTIKVYDEPVEGTQYPAGAIRQFSFDVFTANLPNTAYVTSWWIAWNGHALSSEDCLRTFYTTNVDIINNTYTTRFWREILADAELNGYAKGYADAKAEWENTGYTEGYNDGYAAGYADSPGTEVPDVGSFLLTSVSAFMDFSFAYPWLTIGSLIGIAITVRLTIYIFKALGS